MTSVHFWQVVVDENRGPVLRTLAGSTGSPWLSAGGGRAVEGPPAPRAALRAVEPPEAVAGPREDGGARHTLGLRTERLRLPAFVSQPQGAGVLGRYLGFGGWGPHE